MAWYFVKNFFFFFLVKCALLKLIARKQSKLICQYKVIINWKTKIKCSIRKTLSAVFHSARANIQHMYFYLKYLCTSFISCYLHGLLKIRPDLLLIQPKATRKVFHFLLTGLEIFEHAYHEYRKVLASIMKEKRSFQYSACS